MVVVCIYICIYVLLNHVCLCVCGCVCVKGAADNAVKDMESKDAIQAEFVRLSNEIEKGNAFEGHKGENDDVFRYQETMAEQVAVAACCSVVLCVAVCCSALQ